MSSEVLRKPWRLGVPQLSGWVKFKIYFSASASAFCTISAKGQIGIISNSEGVPSITSPNPTVIDHKTRLYIVIKHVYPECRSVWATWISETFRGNHVPSVCFLVSCLRAWRIPTTAWCTIETTVGSARWHHSYLNSSILDPLTVAEWVASPSTVCQSHGWFNPSEQED